MTMGVRVGIFGFLFPSVRGTYYIRSRGLGFFDDRRLHASRGWPLGLSGGGFGKR